MGSWRRPPWRGMKVQLWLAEPRRNEGNFRMSPLRISRRARRFRGEDAIVCLHGDASQPIGDPSIGRPAIAPAQARTRYLLQPVVQMHSTEIVKVVGGEDHFLAGDAIDDSMRRR